MEEEAIPLDFHFGRADESLEDGVPVECSCYGICRLGF